MNTIKDLAIKWWDTKVTKNAKCELTRKYYPRLEKDYGFNKCYLNLRSGYLEDIFYQEVIIKWFQSHALYQLCNTMVKDEIIAAYAVEEIFNNPNLCALFFGGALEVKQPYFKGKGEHSVNELEKMCQQYKDYVSHINSQPKAIDNNVWDEFAKEYSQLHSLDLEQVRYWFIPLLEFGKQNYSLIKK
jgi:hypothetical protein